MQISILRLDNSDKIFHFSGSSLNDNWLFQKFHLKSTTKDIHACLMQEWFVRLRNIISALKVKECMQDGCSVKENQRSCFKTNKLKENIGRCAVYLFLLEGLYWLSTFEWLPTGRMKTKIFS